MHETTASDPYDLMPYDGRAFAHAQPNRLALVGRLFGLEPASPARCRVLELGCACGENLVPAAMAAPDATFLGIDASARQIDQAKLVAQELGLRNLTLLHRNIRQIGPADGLFDYIIAHGIYSWVPAEVRAKVLSICRDNLAPNGIAYVSYNTYPGWHSTEVIRNIMLYYAGTASPAPERLGRARSAVDFIADNAMNAEGPYARQIRALAATLRGEANAYVRHDYMEEENQPVYFHQFMAAASGHGLQYVAEAQISAMATMQLGPDRDAALRQFAPERLAREQTMDFLRNRAFRQTLLCHRGIGIRDEPDAEAVRRCYITLRAKLVPGADGTVELHAEPGRVIVRHPLVVAALQSLAESWPRAMAYDDLLSASLGRLPPALADRAGEPVLRQHLLQLYTARLLELSLLPPPAPVRIGPHPIACPYVRQQARRGGPVVTLQFQPLPVDDTARAVLIAMDGTRNHDELLHLLRRNTADSLDETAARRQLNKLFAGLARRSLLMSPC